MKIKDLIKTKGFEVIAVDGDTPVAEAIRKMVDRNIGALIIMEEGNPKGMFTERDVLKCWVKGRDFAASPVKEAMSRDLVVAEVGDDLEYAMSIMTQRGVRHLPVLDGGRLVSVLSIRDVVKAQVSHLKAEVHFLKDFITEIG